MNMQSVIEETKKTGEELLQLVTFRLGDEEFGVNILNVEEINRMVEITRVPNSPSFVEGVINLRGRVIPIINLRKRFGLNSRDMDRDTRIMVMDINGKTVGMVVDAVSEVLRIPSDTVVPAPAITSGINSRYIKGIGKLDDRLIILLDLEKLFKDSDLDEPFLSSE
jgi:purine-binding chemotaxis protein CheW